MSTSNLETKFLFFFFFNDTATTEIYTLSLHDALPISHRACANHCDRPYIHPFLSCFCRGRLLRRAAVPHRRNIISEVSGKPLRQTRSEEHTSELQSRLHLVCRLLLEKKKIKTVYVNI